MGTPVRLDIGSTIDASFQVVRRHPRATLLPVTAVSLVSFLVSYGAIAGVFAVLGAFGLFETLILGVGQSPLEPATPERPVPGFDLGGIAAPGVGQIVAAAALGLVALVASALLAASAYASVIQQVGAIIAGREPAPFAAAVRHALAAGLRALPVWVAVQLGVVVLIGAVVGVVVAVAALGDPIAAGLLGLFLGLATVAVLIALVVRLCLFPAAFALEGTGFGSLRRSWRLTAGNAGRVALVLMVAVLISLTVSFGVGLVTGFLQLIAAGDPTVGRIVAFAIVLPLSLLASILGLVALAAPLTMSYLRLRAGREGDDLAAAAERFAAGDRDGRPGASARPDDARGDAGAPWSQTSPGTAPRWDFEGGAADGSWVSRHSPPPGVGDARSSPAPDDAERERFGRDAG